MVLYGIDHLSYPSIYPGDIYGGYLALNLSVYPEIFANLTK